MNKLIIALGLILGLAAPVSVSAQEVEYPAAFNEPMPLLDEAMGDFHYPVSTASELAQRYFDQGFQLMYGFAKIEAARSFHASRLADPDCAICYWGEAWAWGSYLNGAMTVSEAPRALAMARRALELIDNASPKEADLIRAIQVRYIEDYDPQARRAQRLPIRFGKRVDQASNLATGQMPASFAQLIHQSPGRSGKSFRPRPCNAPQAEGQIGHQPSIQLGRHAIPYRAVQTLTDQWANAGRQQVLAFCKTPDHCAAPTQVAFRRQLHCLGLGAIQHGKTLFDGRT